MKNKKLLKIGVPLIIIAIFISGFAFINSDFYRKKALKKKVYDASQKTIQYYYDTYKKDEFAGIMDWPALGLYGFGEDISGEVWTVNGKNAAYFREKQIKNGQGLSKTKNTDYQRTIIGITSAKKDPRNFGGINLVKAVKDTMLENGHFADSVEDKRTKKPVGDDLINSQCFGTIALHCAGEPIPNRDKAMRWLEKNQHHDGGFTWDVKNFDDKEDYLKTASDVDMTSAVLMALSILKVDKDYPPVKRALEYLKSHQLDNGGFESWGTENPESAVWAIQALLMYGENPLDKKWEKDKDCNPVTFILKHQLPNGAFTHVLDEKDMSPLYNNSLTTYECLYGMADIYNEETTYDRLFKANKPNTEKILFSDLLHGSHGYKEVIDVVYNYIMDSYSDGTFKPKKEITKGDLGRYLVNLLNLQGDFYKKFSGDELKFVKENKKSNVLEIDSNNNYIEICIEKGLFKDIPSLNKKGDMDKKITGKEFITALENGAKLKNKTVKVEELKFKSFSESETVNRLNCAISFSKFKQLIK
ncbi:prenyltransferase/squalene oxidase repeat-containing protein [Clostridium rectalis]|uniref:prenyltransferase/squalene oxidase repeat-containing protein n=1 Tax=Clostridium rectalis TaxID=2040295 RepID=UPI000F63A2A8|nr:prenyltransferase/squalene oxidase repeat-containing protein [Clostridium rectalis]